ncbi:MAG: YIEGIA domain-containing protein [Clostridia bacterium]|nr:YIEGIA domain-containing protein [Clostridia bacterium]
MQMEFLSKAITTGFLMGLLARILTLKSDYRRYPSYPQGYAVHIVLGAVASLIGAMVIPSVVDGEYTAVSFFTLAVQQFREVKNAERDTLTNLEDCEIVRRGNAYIEDISRKFEIRNYLAMMTSFFVSVAVLISKSVIIGIGVGAVLFILIIMFIHEKYIRDIGEIRYEKLYFDNMYLKVEDIVITNIAADEVRKVWLERGKAVRIIPKDEASRTTLANLGQQQAIIHDVIAQLGAINDAEEPWFTPYAKMDIKDGSIVIAVVTFENDEKHIEKAVENCPVIESARKEPRKNKARQARRKDS